MPRFLRRSRPGLSRRLDAVAEAQRRRPPPRRAICRGPDEYYNSAVTLGTSPIQVYHKVHLVPFGEFVPPGLAWTLRLVNIPMADISRGRTRQPLEAAGQRIAVNICYEDAFGEEIARQLPEATLLVNVSNVAWFGDSLAPAQHLQIAQAARHRDRAHVSHRHQYRNHGGDRARRPRTSAPAAVRRRPARGHRAGVCRRDALCPMARLADCAALRGRARRARHWSHAAAGRIPGLHADLPAADPAAERVLGSPGLRAAAALRHGGRRGHLPHRDLPARDRPRAVERGLRAALAPAEGRPLRREPEPPAALLPVPGGAEALARRHPGPAIWSRCRRSASTRTSTTSASSRTTGSRPRSAPGVWAGRCGSTAWRSRSSPTSRKSAASPASRCSARSPTASSASRCTCRARRTSSTWCGPTGCTYGDVYHQNEVEQSRYNFELANTEMLFRHFNEFESEAKRLIEAQCVLPAYEMVLQVLAHLQPARCARRHLGHRARGLHRPRAHAGQGVAQAYYESRERLGFPMRRKCA